MMPPGAGIAETVDQPKVEEDAKPRKVRKS
jgi:hypothetical protein